MENVVSRLCTKKGVSISSTKYEMEDEKVAKMWRIQQHENAYKILNINTKKMLVYAMKGIGFH